MGITSVLATKRIGTDRDTELTRLLLGLLLRRLLLDLRRSRRIRKWRRDRRRRRRRRKRRKRK